MPRDSYINSIQLVRDHCKTNTRAELIVDRPTGKYQMQTNPTDLLSSVWKTRIRPLTGSLSEGFTKAVPTT